MAETQTKPEKEETTDKTPEDEKLDEEIAVFEPVEKAVDRKLTYNDEERTYVQHEMGFMTKIRFTKLLATSVRQATETEGVDFLGEFLSPGQIENPDAMINGLLRLVETTPEFIEEAYCYALNVPPQDRPWAMAAFENLSDEEGLDILETLVAQNGESIRDFFTQKLGRIGKRLQAVMNQGQDKDK